MGFLLWSFGGYRSREELERVCVGFGFVYKNVAKVRKSYFFDVGVLNIG